MKHQFNENAKAGEEYVLYFNEKGHQTGASLLPSNIETEEQLALSKLIAKMLLPLDSMRQLGLDPSKDYEFHLYPEGAVVTIGNEIIFDARHSQAVLPKDSKQAQPL